ncbi:hypothetical protein BA898_06255 [Spiribacter roseus]|nr:hypothetical protein BA898_06255 [Spiribacter roseus]
MSPKSQTSVVEINYEQGYKASQTCPATNTYIVFPNCEGGSAQQRGEQVGYDPPDASEIKISA